MGLATIPTIMYGSIADDILNIVLEQDQTTHDLYVMAEALFCSNEESHAIILLNEFHSLQQGNLSITTYCKEQKHLTNALYDIYSLITNHTLILNVLYGLRKTMFGAPTMIDM
ncbi:uncharacterized protein LOC133928051 [Phragmites australis]|uniref:uncharacterized protein LOC133928051 n=1 Tax=Phragmites australis TaxID=29695 RepID=UPI002D780D24|nr:uncharacterized protein LOC133928051 [Phragmites australis]